VIDDVRVRDGALYVISVENGPTDEVEVEPLERLGPRTGLEDANPLTRLEEPANQDVAETTASTCHQSEHAAE
jgi:hypothetical protein